MKEVYLYGAGRHAKVIIDILESNNLTVSEIYDDNSEIKIFENIPVVQKNICSPLIISIGNNIVRKKITENLSEINYHPAVYAKSAIVSDKAEIDIGTVVMQGAVIQHSAKTGKHCIVNTSASIDHDCKIGDFVHIAPRATLCGNVEVGEGTLIGAGTVIIPNIKIGKWAVIGAGAVVIRDVPDYAVVVGNPAKIIRYNDIEN